MSARIQFFLAVWGCIAAIAAFGSYQSFSMQKQEYLDGLDRELQATAIMAESMLPPDFHDHITDRHSLSITEYETHVARHNELAVALGLDYIFSLLLIDEEFRFTTSTSPDKNIDTREHPGFLDLTADPLIFDKSLHTGNVIHSYYDNKWGQGRMALVPFRDRLDRPYLVGTGIGLDTVQGHMHDIALKWLILFIGALLVSAPLAFLLSDKLTQKLQRVMTNIKLLPNGRLAQHIDATGNAEIDALVDCLNRMDHTIGEHQIAMEKKITDKTRQLVDNNRMLELRVAERTKALKRSEERLQGILRVAPEGIITTNDKGIIRLFSEGAERIFGHKEADVIGLSIDFLIPHKYRDVHRQHMQGFKDSTSVYRLMTHRGEIEGLRKSGEVFPATASISRVESDNEVLFTVLLHDITDQKTTEESLRHTREQAEFANRIKNELLAHMSHQLRTPLNTVIGYSDMIRSEILGPVQNKTYLEYIDAINEAGNNLLEMLSDILEVSRIENSGLDLNETEIPLTELLSNSQNVMHAKAQMANISLRLKIHSPYLIIHGDPHRLKQMLLNILSNSIKFTPHGGHITLETRLTETGSLVFCIEDDGIGIPTDKLETVTEPFTQGHADAYTRTESGTGIGLSLVKRIVQAHEGTLHITSTVGVGTKVTIELPAHRVDERLPVTQPA